MLLLVVAALVWLGIHIGISGTRLRDRLVRSTGEVPFRGLFSALSILAIIFLISAFNRAPTVPLWFAPGWLRWCLVLAMLPAFLLFVASISTRNPSLVGAGSTATQPHGMIRVTRHPMLWSFALWAAIHMIGSGEASALLFFGAFLITSLAGMPSIDAKMARRDPTNWQSLSATTSVVPFAAIAAHRNTFVWHEIGSIRALVAIAAWAALLWLHALVFGVAPITL
jgi:uncharacterized membrane protein